MSSIPLCPVSFIRLSADAHPACFPFLAVVTCAEMMLAVQPCLQRVTSVLSVGQMVPDDGMAELCGGSIIFVLPHLILWLAG